MSQQRTYQMVTDRIIARLEEGVIPWNKPWQDITNFQIPVNMKTGKQYRGINILMLLMQGFTSRYWLTFKQAKTMGGQVIKGEKSTPVIFWKIIEVEDNREPEGKKEIPMLRYYNVFNLDQISGIDPPDAPEEKDFEPIQKAEQVIHGMPNPPEIVHIQSRAFYRSSTDTVNLPRPGLFKAPEQYYATAFHELVHSTGHESRLARRPSDVPRNFADKDYSKEELVAELGGAFLCSHAGIENRTINNQAAYLQNWIDVLKESPRAIVQAGSAAQKAVDYILDCQR